MQTGVKTPEQLQAMRQGGKIMAQIYKELRAYVKPGLNELDINAWVDRKIREYGATPTYKEPDVDFPGVICICVNDELVHSPPTDYDLETGDIVSFDLTITYKGMKTDSAFTMMVGEKPKGAAKHLLDVTEKSLYAGISVVKDGVTTGDIGAAVEKVLKAGKLGIIRNYCGHGIGKKMHMPPNITNYGTPGRGEILKSGDTICIEPMASLGKEANYITDDGWTVAMKDGSLCAHCEHTVLVTNNGYEILTQL
ncbi:type I methionyl aminopeptidase [Candidatus Saccharibacteria bacterium]|nr:type I methionyl aminopeptidase [Candidatus Saccharibacteria bacterium]